MEGRVGNAKLSNQRNQPHWVTAWLNIPGGVPLLPNFPNTSSAQNAPFPSRPLYTGAQDSAPVLCFPVSTPKPPETVSPDVDLLFMEQLL